MRSIRVILERGDDPALVTWLSSQFAAVFQRLDNLGKRFDQIDTRLDLMEKNIMATLDQVLQDIADEKTAIASVSELIAGLRKQVEDALAGVTLPPAVQAKIDQVFEGAEANKKALADALAANVPPAPVPSPPVDGGSTPPAANPAAGL